MHTFQIHYRNTQGTLMRILTAVSRRGIDIPYLHAEAGGGLHRADLLLEVNPKQVGQLCRDWHAIMDVTDVTFSLHSDGMIAPEAGFAGPHPPAAVRTSAAGIARA